jgi:hypothetical protein
VKRPYPAMGFANAGPREARSRKRCAPGRFVKKGSRQRATPLATLAISSQGPSRTCDKRCPSRSGWGEAPLASDRVGEVPNEEASCLGRPLARDSRLAVHRKVHRHPRRRRQPKGSRRKQAALLGDQKGGCVGFGRTVVVLAGRIGCRSRQAAFGPSRPRAKSSWITTSGLASSRESDEVANERRKPNRRRQSREIGGGSPKTQEHAKAILQETLCRWKVLWAGKAAVVDAMAVAAALAPRKSLGFQVERGATGSARGRSSAPHAVENTAVERRRLRADARLFTSTRSEAP